jgi:protein required for attachment to host cells
VQLEHGTWIVVADGEKFLLLRNGGDEAFLHLEVVDHETSRNPPARALATDRAGRKQDASRALPGGVEAWGRSAMEETDWHRVAEGRFAEHTARLLRGWAEDKRFGKLVVIADARTLGTLRKAWDDGVRSLIVAELDKDLTNLPLDRIEQSILAHEA